MTSTRDFDVVIVGGGMVGLLLASLLDKHCASLTVAVIEPHAPAPRLATDELDLRVSALSPASLDLLDQADALVHLPPLTRHSYERMRVWQDAGGPHGSHAISFSAADFGVQSLGSIVENNAVRSALWERVSASEGVELITQPAVAIELTADECRLSCGDEHIHARLLVGADGAHSWVREQLGVQSRERPYRQKALVTHLATERPHADTAWQKFLPGGPVAFLPLADGRCSLVWSHAEDRSDALHALPDEEFAAQLQQLTDNVLGELRCTTRRVSFPLVRGHAEAYTGRRFALVGDAAHRVHPLAGQGANLGFQDVAVLAEELGAHMGTRMRNRWADPGDVRVLRRYERRRKSDNALTLTTMDGLNALFNSPLADLAGSGLGLIDRVTPLKMLLAAQAMGAGSAPPR